VVPLPEPPAEPLRLVPARGCVEVAAYRFREQRQEFVFRWGRLAAGATSSGPVHHSCPPAHCQSCTAALRGCQGALMTTGWPPSCCPSLPPADLAHRTFLTKPEALAALAKVRAECAKLQRLSLFAQQHSKSSRLDEFEQAQVGRREWWRRWAVAASREV
jgi:hypothetical protein